MTTFTISFDVPNDKAIEIRDTITDHLGWVDEPTSGTRVEFLRQKIRNHVKAEYKDAKRILARGTVEAALTEVDNTVFD